MIERYLQTGQGTSQIFSNEGNASQVQVEDTAVVVPRGRIKAAAHKKAVRSSSSLYYSICTSQPRTEERMESKPKREIFEDSPLLVNGRVVGPNAQNGSSKRGLEPEQSSEELSEETAEEVKGQGNDIMRDIPKETPNTGESTRKRMNRDAPRSEERAGLFPKCFTQAEKDSLASKKIRSVTTYDNIEYIQEVGEGGHSMQKRYKSGIPTRDYTTIETVRYGDSGLECEKNFAPEGLYARNCWTWASERAAAMMEVQQLRDSVAEKEKQILNLTTKVDAAKGMDRLKFDLNQAQTLLAEYRQYFGAPFGAKVAVRELQIAREHLEDAKIELMQKTKESADLQAQIWELRAELGS